MSQTRKQRFSTLDIVMIGIMAALAYIANYIRVPFLESMVHIGNAVCVLNGLLFGPLAGFLSSGIGNFFYDLIAGRGAESLITMVSKGCISLVSGLIAGGLIHQVKLSKADVVRVVIASVLGSLTYVALYMLKTFIFGLTINGLTMDATVIKMLGKLPASAINALFASIVSPILYAALHSPLRAVGLGKDRRHA